MVDNTFERLCERIKEIDGEEAVFSLLDQIPDLDVVALREGAVREKCFFLAPQNRHFLDARFALPNNGMNFIAVYVAEKEDGTAVEIFGAPYLDRSAEEALYKLILGED